MKKTVRLGIVFLALITTLGLPHLAAAASAPGPSSMWPTGYWGPLVSCTGDLTGKNPNPAGLPPCSNVCDLIQTFINIIYFIISICFFILTPIFAAIGGVMIMVSGANPEMLSKGKSVLTSTVIGLAIVLCSYLLVATVVSVLGIAGVGGFGANTCSTS
jgi:hypothetical protein